MLVLDKLFFCLFLSLLFSRLFFSVMAVSWNIGQPTDGGMCRYDVVEFRLISINTSFSCALQVVFR